MVALFNVTLTFFILRKNLRIPINVFFGIYLLSLSVWALALLGYQMADYSSLAILYGKVAYAAALLIGASFYLFSFVFPEGKSPGAKMLALVYGLCLLYAVALLQPSFLIEKITLHEGGRIVEENIGDYLIFALIFCSLYIGGLWRIFNKYRIAEGVHKGQLMMIGLSSAITGTGGMYFNLILASPFAGDFNYLWTGPVFATSISVMILYSVFRLHLFNTKVIVTELLIALLWIFTLLRTFIAVTPEEQLWNGTLFALSFIIGALLVRSVKIEVENREKTEVLADDLARANEYLKDRTAQLITSQKEELARTQEVARLKDEFVFLAVHELRTPVTAIRGFLELTEASYKNFPKDVQFRLSAMAQASTHLNQLVNNILEIARTDSRMGALAAKPEVFKPILDEVLGEVESLVKKKKITLNLNIAPLPKVLCDDAKLKEVLINLVDNAVKYNRESGTIYIGAYAAPGENFMVFEIRDTGYGIPKEQQEKIFQKFFRAVTHETHEILGTGLGLFITRMLVEKMGGKLMFTSVEHEGTTFSFTLPLATSLRAHSGESMPKKINKKNKNEKKTTSAH